MLYASDLENGRVTIIDSETLIRSTKSYKELCEMLMQDIEVGNVMINMGVKKVLKLLEEGVPVSKIPLSLYAFTRDRDFNIVRDDLIIWWEADTFHGTATSYHLIWYRDKLYEVDLRPSGRGKQTAFYVAVVYMEDSELRISLVLFGDVEYRIVERAVYSLRDYPFIVSVKDCTRGEFLRKLLIE